MEENLEAEELSKAVLILWCIWTFRNSQAQKTTSILCSREDCFKQICRSFNARWEEMKEATSYPTMLQRVGSCISHIRWEAPPEDRWKMNTDASWSDRRHCGSVSWVVRDSRGSPICVGFKICLRKWPIKALEDEVILTGLCGLNCCERPLPNHIFVESDSAEVIGALNSPGSDLSEAKNVFDDVVEVASLLGIVSFNFCPRSCNSMSHNIARTVVDMFFGNDSIHRLWGVKVVYFGLRTFQVG